MKKVFFLLVFVIASLVSYSQDPLVFKTYGSQVGKWNYYEKTFDYEETNYTNLTFKVYQDYVSVDDDARSIYRFKKTMMNEKSDNSQVTGWSCLDEKNRECEIYFVFNHTTKNIVILLIYDKTALRYFVKKTE